MEADTAAVQEGVSRYRQGQSAFDGGVYHQAPLLLPLFALLPDYQTAPLTTNLLYILTDLLSATALMRIAASGEAGGSRLFKSPRRGQQWDILAIGAAYLFNPYTLATCIGRPTSVFTNCAILQAVAAACYANLPAAIFMLAVASYLALYPILLAPAVAILLYDNVLLRFKKPFALPGFALAFAGLYTVQMGALLVTSYFLAGWSWNFLQSTYGVHILLTDLTPNIGLWWYFFMEMFDSFRDFFLGVFWLHMVSYVGGITIRLRKQPLFAIICLIGVFTIFKPYPSIADASLYISLLPLYRHIFPLLRYGFIAMAALLYATFLGPAFYHLWVYAGSGNANFFYAITLVWALGLILIVSDSLFAVLRDEFEQERPEMTGKDVVQI